MTEEPNERSRPPHILIVDDEDFIRSSFQLYFETLGYRVWTADGGESALRIFRERCSELDVVLLDLVMPGIHGIEVLRRMKEMSPMVEIVIATGCGSMNTAIQALRFGAYDYVTKPIVNFEEDLLKVVQDAIRIRRNRAGARAPSFGSGGEECAERPELTPEELIEALEELVRASRPTIPFADRVTALGAFLSRSFSAVAAVVYEQLDEDRVALLAVWGEPPWGFQEAQDRAFSLLQALAVAASLSEDPSWQPVDPEVAAFACTPSAEGRSLEAVLLPLDFGQFREKSRTVRLLALRYGPGKGPQPLAAPRLLSLVVSNALAGAEGAPISVSSYRGASTASPGRTETR